MRNRQILLHPSKACDLYGWIILGILGLGKSNRTGPQNQKQGPSQNQHRTKIRVLLFFDFIPKILQFSLQATDRKSITAMKKVLLDLVVFVVNIA